VFLAPGKDPSLSIAASHEELDFFGIHAPCLLGIRYSHRILEVYAMFVKEMQSLLLIVCPKFSVARTAGSGKKKAIQEVSWAQWRSVL
jgi:hypothetical protein